MNSIFVSQLRMHRSMHGELNSNRRSLQMSDNVLIIYCCFLLSLGCFFSHRLHLDIDDTITIATALYDSFVFRDLRLYKVKASNFYLLQKRSKLDGKIAVMSISHFELEIGKQRFLL